MIHTPEDKRIPSLIDDNGDGYSGILASPANILSVDLGDMTDVHKLTVDVCVYKDTCTEVYLSPADATKATNMLARQADTAMGFLDIITSLADDGWYIGVTPSGVSNTFLKASGLTVLCDSDADYATLLAGATVYDEVSTERRIGGQWFMGGMYQDTGKPTLLKLQTGGTGNMADGSWMRIWKHYR